jgi:hypothetical protein
MAKTNFQYEKRQRELEKKKKAEEKARRKLEAKSSPRRDDEPGEPGEEVQAEGQETRDPA